MFRSSINGIPPCGFWAGSRSIIDLPRAIGATRWSRRLDTSRLGTLSGPNLDDPLGRRLLLAGCSLLDAPVIPFLFTYCFNLYTNFDARLLSWSRLAEDPPHYEPRAHFAGELCVYSRQEVPVWILVCPHATLRQCPQDDPRGGSTRIASMGSCPSEPHLRPWLGTPSHIAIRRRPDWTGLWAATHLEVSSLGKELQRCVPGSSAG